MRVSEDFQGGDAVLCMPRDLFKVGGHLGTSTTFAGSTAGSQKKDEKTSPQRMGAMQKLGFVLPPRRPAPIFSHHCTSVQDDVPVTSKNLPLLNDVPCECSRVMGNTAFSSSANVSVDGTGASRNWRFQVVASLRANSCSLSSDVIAAIDFDETGSRFASGGIARKIRVCSYTSLVSDQESATDPPREENIEEDNFEEERQLLGPHGSGRSFRSSRSYLKRKEPDTEGGLMVQNHDEAALRVISTPAKLSSLKWRPLGSNVIGCGDYDGVVTEWDVEQGLCLSERYEHSGQRIWSVDYSSWFPTLCASASGDGTVRLWTLNCERSVGIIRSPGRNSICCAEFNSDGPHRVAVACADSNVYMYDVRRLDSWLLCLQGHERAASYVRFWGSEELVSASIDSTVKVWDVSNVSNNSRLHVLSGTAAAARGVGGGAMHLVEDWRGAVCSSRLRKSFNSHKNVKNFVGLSAWKEGGLIACGSETDEVFVYERSRNEAVWQMKFPSTTSTTVPPTSRRRRRCQSTCLADGHQQPIEEEEEEEEEEDDIIKARQGRGAFVGAVCWREQRQGTTSDHHSLLTANSQGTLQLVKVWQRHTL